jgi:hypothetical protein
MTMLLEQHIEGLRAELSSNYCTKTERALAEAELAVLIAQVQAEDEQFARDIALYVADLE